MSLRTVSRNWKIIDVEHFLEQDGSCLLIDDFEKAPDVLVQMIADLCKRMTMRPVPKCVIVGTGETFARLSGADEGLDGRLEELTVASFGTQREVWNYINDGFERLGFDTPRAMLKSRLVSKSEAEAIESALYEAADGMPKYINELAMRICYRALGHSARRRVSPSDALSEAGRMLDENISRCNPRIRRVEHDLRTSLELRMVLTAIFRLGANGVHRVNDLVSFIERRLDPDFTYEQFIAGLTTLRGLGLYVQTGKSGEVVFAKDPMFAHVLGLICNNPIRFKKDNNVFGLFGQRNLPLFNNDDMHLTRV